MKRSGFTMIELIFVIVILGILAAVAIPRLSATRDDATIATMATNAATIVSDYGAGFTARADYNATTTWAQITNAPSETAAGTPTAAATVITTPILLTDGTNTCATFTASQSVVGGAYDTLTVASGNTGAVCTNVATRIANLVRAHTFGGTGIVQ